MLMVSGLARPCQLFELVQGFDVKVVQEAAVTASKAVLNPEGAEELTKASGGFDFGAKLLFALLSVLLELSAPAMKLVGMKQAAEEARQAAEAERIAAGHYSLSQLELTLHLCRPEAHGLG